MSYNITLDVADDGTVTIDTDASYTVTAPRGRFIVSGHLVPPGESGTAYVGVSTPDYGITAQANHSVRVPVEADA